MCPEAEALLNWYDSHARVMPWRGIHNPYATWVSETMLQQTRVETVLGYFPRFMAAFPTVEALAAAPEADVLKQWEGLGYYSRARNLHRGARQVAEEYGGQLPASVEALRGIHGIGPYTAGAIASIAFGLPEPAIDGNVQRVTARLRGIRENVRQPATARLLEKAVRELLPPERPGDFNQAVMDLGATLCVPGTPDCAACPLSPWCSAHQQGDADSLPVLPQRNPPKELPYDVLLIQQGGRFLMEQRTEALLHGLWVFPMAEGWHTLAALPAAGEQLTGLKLSSPVPAGEARHVFTHRVWQMRLYLLDALGGVPSARWRFVSPAEMDQLALPTAMRAARAAVDQLAKGAQPADLSNLTKL